MNRSSALQFDYAEAAAIADLIMIVKARFIEAADTMLIWMSGTFGRPRVRSLWPASQVETVGIGGHHPGYGINGNRVPYLPSSKAISRAEEVMYGCSIMLPATKAESWWASSRCAPRIAGSFRQFCKKTGRSRSTVERRLCDAFEGVAGLALKNAQSLQGPNWSRVVPMMPNQGKDFDMVATSTHWMQADAKPQHRPEILDPIKRNAA
jgi:hypothetical protein